MSHPADQPASDPQLQGTQTVPQPLLRAPEPDECEVLLIRHGRSADVVPGSPESLDPPLHTVGHQQAALLAERLRTKNVHAIYSSQLTRAVQTAAPLAADRGLDVAVFRDLEEIRLGDWGNGEFRRRAAIKDPEWVAWNRTGRWDGIPGCEGDDAFRARVSGVIDGVAAQHAGQTIAVVSHGGTINAYLAHLLGIHRSMVFTIENTSITTVRVGPYGPTVLASNDCQHLYDAVLGAD